MFPFLIYYIHLYRLLSILLNYILSIIVNDILFILMDDILFVNSVLSITIAMVNIDYLIDNILD